MAVTRAKKEEILAQLKEDFAKATAIYFTKYSGLSVAEVSELRSKVREADAKMTVAKKTLMKLAAAEAGYKEIPDESMEGPVAAVIAFGDQVAPASATHKFLKEFKELELSLIGALMDGDILSKADTNQLATLPSREELLAKLVGSMKAPISGFHGVLHGVMREFVGVVSAYKDKKDEEGDAPAPAAEEKTEEAKEETPATEEKPEAPAEEAKAEEATEAPAEEAKEEKQS